MKQIILFVLLLTFCQYTSLAADAEGKILVFGVFRTSTNEEVFKTPETPSGKTVIPAGAPILIQITNRIPARSGICFGLWYAVNNLKARDGEEVDILKVVKHPVITKPDGTKSDGFTFVEKQPVNDGRITSWTGYRLNHDYELVPGKWQIEMQFEGKTLFKQDFTVYQEQVSRTENAK